MITYNQLKQYLYNHPGKQNYILKQPVAFRLHITDVTIEKLLNKQGLYNNQIYYTSKIRRPTYCTNNTWKYFCIVINSNNEEISIGYDLCLDPNDFYTEEVK